MKIFHSWNFSLLYAKIMKKNDAWNFLFIHRATISIWKFFFIKPTINKMWILRGWLGDWIYGWMIKINALLMSLSQKVYQEKKFGFLISFFQSTWFSITHTRLWTASLTHFIGWSMSKSDLCPFFTPHS